MFVCKKWLKLSNVCVPRWRDLRRYLQDINPVLLSVVLSVCLVCNSDLELVVNTVFSTMIIMIIIIIRNVLMSRSLEGEKRPFSLCQRGAQAAGGGQQGWGQPPAPSPGAGEPGAARPAGGQRGRVLRVPGGEGQRDGTKVMLGMRAAFRYG